MSHNLNYNEQTGQYAMYSLKEVPWHGLGQIVEEAQTSSEVLKLAQLDWDVVKTPNYALIEGGYEKSKSFSVYRDDNKAILGSQMKGAYEVYQNSDVFSFLDSLVCEKKDIIYHTAGALGDGEVVFVTAKLPDYIRIPGTDDIIEKYVLMTTSHDGSMPVIVQFTNIRVVCNNTLSLALKSADNRVYLRHTKNILDRIEDSRKTLGLELTFSKQFEQALEMIKKIMVRKEQVKEVISKLFMTPEERELQLAGGLSTRKMNSLLRIEESIEVAPGQDLHRGTGLWLYNGITSYFQNVKDYRSQDRKMMGLMIQGEEITASKKAFELISSL